VSAPKHVLTEGLRLAYTPGLLGLHFRIAGVPDSYPNDDVLGGRDMAYINGLIEADERRVPQRDERCHDGQHDWGEFFCRICGHSIVQGG
jgi:hypothetical protein